VEEQVQLAKIEAQVLKNYTRNNASIRAPETRPVILTEARPISFCKTKVFQLQLDDF